MPTSDDWQVMANIATTFAGVGVFVAFLAYLFDRYKTRQEVVRHTYVESNQRYVEYLELCLDHPELDCFDLSRATTKDELDMKVEQVILLTILISMFEASYVLYDANRRGRLHRFWKTFRKLWTSHPIERDRQWDGWVKYMKLWAARPEFRAVWKRVGAQFDEFFYAQMETWIKQTPACARRQAIADDAGKANKPKPN